MKKNDALPTGVLPTTAFPAFPVRRPAIDLEATWTYPQETGNLQVDGKHVSTGYSGANNGKNKPAMDNVPHIGPIPRGDGTIAGPPVDSKDHGPYVLKLNPAPSTETHGRSGFLMHGDSKEHPSSASHGCVILPRAGREERLAKRRQRLGSDCRDPRRRWPQR
jgi:hypothetical protein